MNVFDPIYTREMTVNYRETEENSFGRVPWFESRQSGEGLSWDAGLYFSVCEWSWQDS
jgi:hypothetical protein